MSDFSSYFVDPCELVAIVYASDGIIELDRYSLKGYAKNMNRFFQICNLIAREMTHSNRPGNVSDFQIYLSIIRDFYHAYVKSKGIDNIENAIQKRVDDLKQYKFKSQRLFFLLACSDAESKNYRDFEITVDRIFKWIIKMHQQRINFYEHVLQEYQARKDQYDQRLRNYLDNEGKSSNKKVDKLSIDTVLSELNVKPDKNSDSVFSEEYYDIRSQSWYLKDVLDLENPEIERYTKGLPRYRTCSIHAHPEGLKDFFELFSIFKNEMSFILPDEPDKNFFERVLTVLKRDFLDGFVQRGDLEDTIVEYIEELEKFEFLSLSKEQFFNKLSKMIYSLRTRRIAFYEAVLEDYLANKEKYNAVM